jgi:hypothetical protein
MKIYQLGKYEFKGHTLYEALTEDFEKQARFGGSSIAEDWVEESAKSYLEDEYNQSYEISRSLDRFQKKFAMSLFIQEMGHDPDDLGGSEITLKELQERPEDIANLNLLLFAPKLLKKCLELEKKIL